MKALKYLQTGLLTLIGSVSVFMALSVIFDLFGIREMEGNYVLFIVYNNLACGMIYLFAVYNNRKNIKMSNYSLAVALIVLIVAFIDLLIYINNGGIYEPKTVNAMIFRMAFTLVMLVTGIVVAKKEKIKSSIS